MEINMKAKALFLTAAMLGVTPATAGTLQTWACYTENSNYMIFAVADASLSSSAKVQFGGTDSSSSYSVNGFTIRGTISSSTDCSAQTITIVDGNTTYSESN